MVLPRQGHSLPGAGVWSDCHVYWHWSCHCAGECHDTFASCLAHQEMCARGSHLLHHLQEAFANTDPSDQLWSTVINLWSTVINLWSTVINCDQPVINCGQPVINLFHHLQEAFANMNPSDQLCFLELIKETPRNKDQHIITIESLLNIRWEEISAILANQNYQSCLQSCLQQPKWLPLWHMVASFPDKQAWERG